MTKEWLEKLKEYNKAIAGLKIELKNLPMTTDSVKGSMDEHPYIKRSIQIMGIDERARKNTVSKLEKAEQDQKRWISEFDEWVESVEEPIMRTIFRMKYRELRSTTEIGLEVGYSKASILRKINDYFVE